MFALIVLVLGYGVFNALANVNKPDPPARIGTPKVEDIAAHGKEPNWFAFSTPMISVIGILIGSTLRSQRRHDAAV